MPKGIAKNGKRKSSPRVERVSHTCEVCGKERFYTPKEIQKREKYAKLRFCSVECRDASRKDSERQRRLAQRQPRAQKVQITCAQCEGITLKPPSAVNRSKVHFCSRKCAQKYKAKDKAASGLAKQEYARVYMSKYHKANRDKHNQQSREWSKKNREKRLETQKKYRETHQEEIVALHHQRRTRTEQGTFTGDDWRRMKQIYNYTCLCCGRHEPEIKLALDHIHPIARGGLHQWDNIQPLCQSCNSAKCAKTIDYRPAFSEKLSTVPQTIQLSMF